MIKKNIYPKKFLLGLLILYSFWGFIFTKTIFQLQIMVYIAFIGLLVNFLIMLLYNKTIILQQEAYCWIPFLLYTVITLVKQRDFEFFSYWMICLIIVLVAIKVRMYNEVPYKIFLYGGIFALIGQIVQLLFPDMYKERIASLFLNSSAINYWSTIYGLAGFTYQLDQTAMTLITAEAVVIAFFVTDEDKKRKKLYWLLTGILIIGIFLSGKRMLFLVSIVALFIVYFLQQKSLSKKIIIFILMGIVSTIVLIYFASNINSMYTSRFFYRFAKTFMDLKSKADFSDGRSELYIKAINAFKQNPIFGIGIGRFASYTGENTAVHNTYLQVLCEQGIVGIVLYIFPLVVALIYTIKEIKVNDSNFWGMKYYKFSLFIQLTYIMYALTENVNINMFGYMVYFISFGVFLSVKYNDGLKEEK